MNISKAVVDLMKQLSHMTGLEPEDYGYKGWSCPHCDAPLGSELLDMSVRQLLVAQAHADGHCKAKLTRKFNEYRRHELEIQPARNIPSPTLRRSWTVGD